MLNKDLYNLMVFAASRFFGRKDWNGKVRSNFIYSYNGSSIFDFQRKGYVRIFPQSSIKFELFDFLTGNLYAVSKPKNDILDIKNHKTGVSQSLQL